MYDTVSNVDDFPRFSSIHQAKQLIELAKVP